MGYHIIQRTSFPGFFAGKQFSWIIPNWEAAKILFFRIAANIILSSYCSPRRESLPAPISASSVDFTI